MHPSAFSNPAFRYRWSWSFAAGPDRLWPLVSDTQRFNEAAGLPPTSVTETPDPEGGAHRIMRFRRFGVLVEWDEHPFEWVQPEYFGVLRVYHNGPVAWMKIRVTLEGRPDGGTDLHYEVLGHPSNLLGYLFIPLQIHRVNRRGFDRVFREIDRHLRDPAQQSTPFPLSGKPLRPGGAVRVKAITRRLIEAGHDPALVERLHHYIRHAPDVDLQKMRPFALADVWGADRFETLELFLRASKAGWLDVQWELLCPECRGTKSTAPTLDNVRRHVHCSSCNIDYEVDFDHSVEVTFHPNPSIKRVERVQYCIGGPQNTPHILAQQTLAPDEDRTCSLSLMPGRYRIRGPKMPGRPHALDPTLERGADSQTRLEVEPAAGTHTLQVVIDAGGIRPSTSVLQAGEATLVFRNRTRTEQRVIVEHTAWADQAATAAQVTTLQAFRDLFSSEALRPREQIAVTSLTLLFTDIRESTTMYRKIGDAPAFGRVMDHFGVLKAAVAQRHGSVVKTIGDAVMGAFYDPADAVAAALEMLRGIDRRNAETDAPPIMLKIGLHRGPCIAITLNERLDYFGSTVNIAARIVGQSRGREVILSETVETDQGVERLLANEAVNILPFTAELKGFQDSFPLYRLRLSTP